MQLLKKTFLFLGGISFLIPFLLWDKRKKNNQNKILSQLFNQSMKSRMLLSQRQHS